MSTDMSKSVVLCEVYFDILNRLGVTHDECDRQTDRQTEGRTDRLYHSICRASLQKFTCHYNIRKYSFCSRVINIWNSLPDNVVEADSINSIKSRLDKYWTNQDVIYHYDCDLTGTGGLPICM